MNTPDLPPPLPPRSRPGFKDSVAIGIAIVVGATLGFGLLAGALVYFDVLRSLVGIFVALGVFAPFLPAAFMIIGAQALKSRGYRKTAKGIYIGIGIVFGIALLLVAACFGLLINSGLGE